MIKRMKTIFVTRQIPEAGMKQLIAAGFAVDVSTKDGVLTKEELIAALKTKPYDAVLSLLTDRIDADVLAAAPNAKIIANYAVGFDNIDTAACAARGVFVSNTPDVLTTTVAEHTMALMLAIMTRVVESDAFLRSGKYAGWEPMLFLGSDLRDKTLGILGGGRIGCAVAAMAKNGFGMRIAYCDVAENETMRSSLGAAYYKSVDEFLPMVDVVSLHVPLLPATRHLINAERLGRMKKTAYLVNTSRGGVIDEAALVSALSQGVVKGAALDVFENEPELAPGLASLANVIITPHIASASEETRNAMAVLAAKNIIAALQGEVPPNALTAS